MYVEGRIEDAEGCRRLYEDAQGCTRMWKDVGKHRGI
jgi:hypothetical protein